MTSERVEVADATRHDELIDPLYGSDLLPAPGQADDSRLGRPAEAHDSGLHPGVILPRVVGWQIGVEQLGGGSLAEDGLPFGMCHHVDVPRADGVAALGTDVNDLVTLRHEHAAEVPDLHSEGAVGGVANGGVDGFGVWDAKNADSHRARIYASATQASRIFQRSSRYVIAELDTVRVPSARAPGA